MQNIDLTKLIQFKLDFSVVQDSLTLAMKDMINRITHLQSSYTKIQQTNANMQKQTHKLYQIIQQEKQKTGHSIKQLDDKINKLGYGKIYGTNQLQLNMKQNINQQYYSMQKSPRQILDHIESKLHQKTANQGQKQVDIICSPGNINNGERMCEVFRVKDQQGVKDGKTDIDGKLYDLYAKSIEKLQADIVDLRKQLKSQINQFTNKSVKFIDTKINGLKVDFQEKQKMYNKNNKGQKNNNSSQKDKISFNSKNSTNEQNTASAVHKSKKQLIISTKVIDSTNFNLQPKSLRNIQSQQNNTDKQQLKQYISELKQQLKTQIKQMVKSAQQKFEQINRTNSVIADHLLSAKKQLQDIINDKDTLKIQMAGVRQKSLGYQGQIAVIIDSHSEYKNKFKSIQNSLNKVIQQIKQYKNQYIKQQNEQQQSNSANSSKKQIFRDSHTSFRSSINNGNSGLAPIRNNSMLKVNNNRIDILQQTIKTLNNRLTSLIDRFNKNEDDRKRYDSQLTNSMLPKIQKQNKSNINPLQLIKQQLKKVNNDILKTNQKLTNTKDKLSQLYQAHACIPLKIQDIYKKLQQNNQLQQDRLIQLIKQLINRMLSDPFDNHFTNRLKRQINVKFLEIKYQYNCILKEIQSKVQSRAEKIQMEKLMHKYQESILQVKSIANKKCQTQDFKKGIKYLENKIKQVFQFARTQTVALANQQKQYIGAKKQPLH